MTDKVLALNTPGRSVTFTAKEAAELGAFEETALCEADALAATEADTALNEADTTLETFNEEANELKAFFEETDLQKETTTEVVTPKREK
jgi:hypothetical protein